jgi:hypothetical protein
MVSNDSNASVSSGEIRGAAPCLTAAAGAVRRADEKREKSLFLLWFRCGFDGVLMWFRWGFDGETMWFRCGSSAHF